MAGKKTKIWVIGVFLALFVGQFLVGGSVRAQDQDENDSSFWRPEGLDSAIASVWSRLGPSAITSQADLQAMYDRSLDLLRIDLNNATTREEKDKIQAKIRRLEELRKPKNLENAYKKGMKKSQADQRRAAAANANTLEKTIGRIFAWLLYYIASGLGWILSKVVGVMLIVATYNNFLKQEAVVIGWKITRDICNNFFIILLLVTAIGTMLRQQAYQWKEMLPKILMAAVLINFSMMFCGIMIDVSQVFTLTFAGPIATSTGYNIILASMGLPNYSNFKGAITAASAGATGGTTNWDFVAALIYAIIMTIVTLVVVVAFTAMLAYRVIILWFLVILSPLPFLLGTFDKGKQYASQWWSMFTKNLIFGPVMMFFLFLSFVTMSTFVGGDGQGGKGKNALGLTPDPSVDKERTGSMTGLNSLDLSTMGTVNGMINAMIIIGLMVGSLYMGQQIGGTGASFAGQGLNFFKTRAKKYSGFNLGKNAAIGATKLPGKAATAIDDKLGLRQKLYSGAYNMGGKYIPGTKGFFGGKMRGLEDGTKKRNNQYYADVASARGMDKMDEAKLRKLAMSRNKAESVAATQALMKKGYFSDGDDANRESNLSIIRETRKNLKGTELGDAFDDNLRKYNPNLALNTMYDKNGKINMEKLRSDLKTGKADIDKIMKGVDKFTLNKLQKALGDDDDAVAKFINEHSDDLTKTNKSMSSDVQKAVWSGVTADTFKSRKIAKDEKTGEIIKGADGQPKMEDHFDEDARKAFLSFRKTTKAFQTKDPVSGQLIYDEKGKEAAHKYLNKTGDKFLEEMEADDMTGDFMARFGDKYSSKSLKEKFFDGRGKLGEQKMTEALGLSLENIADANNDVVEMIIRNNLAIVGSVNPEKLLASRPNDARERYRGALDKMDAREISNIKWSNADEDQRKVIIDSVNSRKNIKKNLALYSNKEVDELLIGIQTTDRERMAAEKAAKEEVEREEAEKVEADKKVKAAKDKVDRDVRDKEEWERGLR